MPAVASPLHARPPGPNQARHGLALRESFAHVPRTLRLVWKSAPGGTFMLAIFTLLSAILPVAMTWVGKQVVDGVVAQDGPRTRMWVIAELILVAGLALISRIAGVVRGLVGARLSLDINGAILDKAIALDLKHFEDPEFYDRLTRARREASSRPLSVITQTFSIGQGLVTLGGFVVLLIGYSGWVVLGLLLAAVPATIAEMRFSGAAFRLRNWRAPDSRKLMYLEYVLANDDHAKEVKLFGLGAPLLARYRELGERFYDEDRSLAVRRAVWGYLLSLLGTFAFYACYVVMALAAASGRITIGELTLYAAAFRQGQQAFQAVLGAIGGMYEDSLYMSNLFAYLDTSQQTDEVIAPTELVPSGSGFIFQDVGFRYSGSEAWALRHINLVIPPGQSLALVGENGAGKTTFIKLLTGLYHPSEGRILLDGKDLRDWDSEALRARVGVIFQDFNQYQLKVRDNVGFGSVAHVDDDARVGRAVDQGGASELVEGLAAKLDTQLGRWFKEGAELSGGQWQKLAIARAFMREQADILVLDEPTAALDARAERAVFERFRELTRGRTTILISHRFPTVRMAEKILVIEGGQIQEQGSHAELVAQGGRYAAMFALQAEGYK
jgi:ATP-binding cassette subfamily B protein